MAFSMESRTRESRISWVMAGEWRHRVDIRPVSVEIETTAALELFENGERLERLNCIDWTRKPVIRGPLNRCEYFEEGKEEF